MLNFISIIIHPQTYIKTLKRVPGRGRGIGVGIWKEEGKNKTRGKLERNSDDGTMYPGAGVTTFHT